ncbi:sulfotransferase domain-containing protein [Candidatus Pelagibacter sp. HIMB1506]|uniref:sulfotransferase domain-containing protein n=1 Tax=Candidatus Pelagibacter sp. HIMB1506 TaxID=3413337 RepID=UPI003F828D59
MFIWLASYPKSGNTLVRAMLSSYFFSKDGKFNFELIKNIKQFPHIGIFEKLGINIKDEKEILKNYIKAQESINQKNSIQFLKTHSYLFNINNNPFTDLNNTLGVIYIVRDPRNVVTSYAHHNSISVEDSVERLTHSIEYGGNVDSDHISDRSKVYMGSWSSNYNSWKSFDTIGKYLLIKYEDIILNKEKTLLEILNFIYRLKGINFSVDKKKIENVISSTNFDKMKDLEKKEGFIEAKVNPKTGKKIPFFNLGSKNVWKNNLDLTIKNKIENSFKKEMLEIGYL